jgi:hypothetical protein
MRGPKLPSRDRKNDSGRSQTVQVPLLPGTGCYCFITQLCAVAQACDLKLLLGKQPRGVTYEKFLEHLDDVLAAGQRFALAGS